MDEAKRFYFIFPDLHKKTKIRKHFFSTSSFIDHHNPVSSHVLIWFSFSHLNEASLPRENPFVIAFHKREDWSKINIDSFLGHNNVYNDIAQPNPFCHNGKQSWVSLEEGGKSLCANRVQEGVKRFFFRCENWEDENLRVILLAGGGSGGGGGRKIRFKLETKGFVLLGVLFRWEHNGLVVWIVRDLFIFLNVEQTFLYRFKIFFAFLIDFENTRKIHK